MHFPTHSPILSDAPPSSPAVISLLHSSLQSLISLFVSSSLSNLGVSFFIFLFFYFSKINEKASEKLHRLLDGKYLMGDPFYFILKLI